MALGLTRAFWSTCLVSFLTSRVGEVLSYGRSRVQLTFRTLSGRPQWQSEAMKPSDLGFLWKHCFSVNCIFFNRQVVTSYLCYFVCTLRKKGLGESAFKSR